MTIAHKLSEWFDISVMHPAEFAPFPFSLMKKYKNIVGRQGWSDDGMTVKPFKYIRLFGKKNAFRLLPCYKKQIGHYIEQFGTPDMVHAHFALPDGYLAYLIHKTNHVPYLISFRKTDIEYLNLGKEYSSKKMMLEVLSHAQQIIVHNAAQQETLSRYGFSSILMAHGIEDSFVQPKMSINNSNSLTIVSIGELVPAKHIDWVINAVKNYKGNKNISLMIAGEGPMRQTWETLSAADNNISFLGQISHDKINELLQQSDIFALPSINETFGLVYIEAAAHQNAVIATKGTGIWGHFVDNNEILYCDSYENFQHSLSRLIDDDLLRNQMALNAFEKAKKNYTWSAVINKYNLLYQSILGKQ